VETPKSPIFRRPFLKHSLKLNLSQVIEKAKLVVCRQICKKNIIKKAY